MARKRTAQTANQRTRIRKNDIVQVIAGKGAAGLKRRLKDGDPVRARQERGKVLEIDRSRGRALVEGIKLVTKSQRTKNQDPSRPRERFIQKESPVNLSNLMLVCPACDEATRIGIRVEPHERDGGRIKNKRIRVCKRCGKDILERS